MSTSILKLDALLPISSIEAYIARINAFAKLTKEQEHSLADRLVHLNDLEAARQLVLANLRYVVKIARAYMGYGLPLADLIQEGNIGLMKAVKRFKPEQEVRLISFAVHWIKAEIQEFILKNWRIVKIATTKSQRKLFFNLRKFSKKLSCFNSSEAQHVADELKVKVKTVREMENRLAHYDVGLYPSTSAGDNRPESESILHSLAVVEADPAYLVEQNDLVTKAHHQLKKALSTLDERAREILIQRWLTEPKATLDELSKRFKVSIERISQLEKNAVKKLRALITLESNL